VEGPEWPEEEIRKRQPEAGPAARTPIPGITTFALASGPKVFLVERHDLPIAVTSLDFEVGAIDDPKGKEGTASLCLDLVGEGSRARDKAAFEAAQADLAANVAADSGTETVSVSVSTLRRTLEPALDLAFEILRDPGLRAEDLERLRERRITGIQQARAAAGSVAGRVWESVVYGPAHPYARIPTEASLKAITLQDCRKLLARLGPGNLRVFVFGDVERNALELLLEARLAGWKGGAPPKRRLPAPKPMAGTVFLVDIPGAPQSQLYVGHPGPERGAADYAATELMARILGGGFSSRINMNIREDKGFAYGAAGGFDYERSASYFAATSSVRTDATVPALQEILEEIQGMRAGEPTAVEIAREKEGTLLALPARFATGGDVLRAYAELEHYGLPVDWYQRYQEDLAGASAADLRGAAERHLRQDGFKVLVAGDGATVREALEALAAQGVFGKEGFVVLDGDARPVDAGASKRAVAKGS
jgi:zinc protease